MADPTGTGSVLDQQQLSLDAEALSLGRQEAMRAARSNVQSDRHAWEQDLDAVDRSIKWQVAANTGDGVKQIGLIIHGIYNGTIGRVGRLGIIRPFEWLISQDKSLAGQVLSKFFEALFHDVKPDYKERQVTTVNALIFAATFGIINIIPKVELSAEQVFIKCMEEAKGTNIKKLLHYPGVAAAFAQYAKELSAQVQVTDSSLKRADLAILADEFGKAFNKNFAAEAVLTRNSQTGRMEFDDQKMRAIFNGMFRTYQLKTSPAREEAPQSQAQQPQPSGAGSAPRAVSAQQSFPQRTGP